MHLTSALLSVAAVAIGTVNAAALQSRVPLMGYFRASTAAQCPMETSDFYQVGLSLGPDDTSCRTFWNNITYGAINVEYWHPQCQIVIHSTSDCSDPGVLSGTGCWAPEGGFKAYKGTCPYRTW